MDLTGKVALVTGASRGIGKAIAKKLAKYNATVIINYSGNEINAKKTLNEIKELGKNAEIYKCDISNFNDVEEMIKSIVQKYNKIDILINNAGITKDGLIMRMSEEDFDCVIDVNLKGTFNCIKHVSRQMIKQRSGCIVNMSSIVGIAGNAGQVNYSASKAGIIGITKSVSKELASRGITVNAIAPGYIDTDMTKVLSEEIKQDILKTVPLKRMGTVEDVANTVLFLVSDYASYITGQVICVDGGMN